jgi:hypothetical protein
MDLGTMDLCRLDCVLDYLDWIMSLSLDRTRSVQFTYLFTIYDIIYDVVFYDVISECFPLLIFIVMSV